MMTVKEVSRITGLSVRTLHHYDDIGLLKPSAVTDAGYRLYDEKALERLQSILLFRELDFPLRDIARIVDSPDFDRDTALSQQIAILKAQKDRLEKLISMAYDLKGKGVSNMNFKPFDKTELESLKAEAKTRWGDTDAWRESEKKEKSGRDPYAAGEKMMVIFEEIGKFKSLSPDSPEVQVLVSKLQSFITENFYTCTNEILFSLGQMYIADERFKKNIDSVGGEGTAQFVNEAIAVYCSKK